MELGVESDADVMAFNVPIVPFQFLMSPVWMEIIVFGSLMFSPAIIMVKQLV